MSLEGFLGFWDNFSTIPEKVAWENFWEGKIVNLGGEF